MAGRAGGRLAGTGSTTRAQRLRRGQSSARAPGLKARATLGGKRVTCWGFHATHQLPRLRKQEQTRRGAPSADGAPCRGRRPEARGRGARVKAKTENGHSDVLSAYRMPASTQGALHRISFNSPHPAKWARTSMPISQARMGAEGSRKSAPGHESPEPWQATTAHQQSRLCLPNPSLRGRAPLTSPSQGDPPGVFRDPQASSHGAL